MEIKKYWKIIRLLRSTLKLLWEGERERERCWRLQIFSKILYNRSVMVSNPQALSCREWVSLFSFLLFFSLTQFTSSTCGKESTLEETFSIHSGVNTRRQCLRVGLWFRYIECGYITYMYNIYLYIYRERGRLTLRGIGIISYFIRSCCSQLIPGNSPFSDIGFRRNQPLLFIPYISVVPFRHSPPSFTFVRAIFPMPIFRRSIRIYS